MVHAMLCVFGVALVLFMTNLIVRSRRGFSIGKHLYLFGVAYDDVYNKTGEKFRAIETAFAVFHTCPGLRELNAEEIEAAVVVLSLAPDPKWVVEQLMLKFDSQNMLRAFRDVNFLTKVVDVGMRRG